VDIGTIEEILENDTIIYIIPRKDNTKYIKYIKVNGREDFFNSMINLFNNLRVLIFIWPTSPAESSKKINNIMIKCKDTDNSNFVANFNSIVNDDDGDEQYKSTNYVKTLICPNGEYTLLVDYKVRNKILINYICSNSNPLIYPFVPYIPLRNLILFETYIHIRLSLYS